MVLSHQGPHTA